METRIFYKVAKIIGLVMLCHQLSITQSVYGGLRIPCDSYSQDQSRQPSTSGGSQIKYGPFNRLFILNNPKSMGFDAIICGKNRAFL